MPHGARIAVAAALLACLPAGVGGQCGLEDTAAMNTSSGDVSEIFGSVPCCHAWHRQLLDATPASEELSLNATKLYFYQNLDVGTLNLPTGRRKLIISLEPCEGVVYIFVRRTRPCWPDPATCCSHPSKTAPSAPPCDPTDTIGCEWTHFHSVIDSNHDSAPTFFEVPMESTKYYFSVFAPLTRNLLQGVTKVRFRLLVTANIGLYPRPGLKGKMEAEHVGQRETRLLWRPTAFMPENTGAKVTSYRVYSTLLLDSEEKQSASVFIGPSKVMNTPCGLERNALTYGEPLSAPAACQGETCSATITNIIPGRRYAFNVVVVGSVGGLETAYSGIIVSADWMETKRMTSDKAMGLLAAITTTVLGVVLIGYIWIVKLYE